MNLHQFYIKSKREHAIARQNAVLCSFLVDFLGDTSAYPTLQDLLVGATRAVMRECQDADPNRILALARSLELPHRQ